MKTPPRPKRPVASSRGALDDNLRDQLDQRTHELAEALEQQAATAEVLRVVWGTADRRSARIRNNWGASRKTLRGRNQCHLDGRRRANHIWLFDRRRNRRMEWRRFGACSRCVWTTRQLRRAQSGLVPSVTFRTYSTILCTRIRKPAQAEWPIEAALAVPMVREGQVVGAIFVARTQPGFLRELPSSAAQDLRRPGSDRDRERAAVRGRAAAQDTRARRKHWTSRRRPPRSCKSSRARPASSSLYLTRCWRMRLGYAKPKSAILSPCEIGDDFRAVAVHGEFGYADLVAGGNQ